MKLQRAIELYLEKVKAEHSEKTWKGYRGRLKGLREKHGKKDIRDVKPKHIEKWIEKATHWADGTPKAPDTIRLTVIAWEQLQKHMLESGEISEPIFDYGKKPGGRRRSKIPTRLEQAKLFREALKSEKREFALMFRCLRLCGARPGELVKADIANYLPERNMIELKDHKTAKKVGLPRQIGVGQTMRRLITRAIGGRTEGPIFTDECGKRWTPEKLSRIYRALRDRLGFSEELVLYCARHEHGTTLCQAFGIAAAQHSLGHRDITTTQRYNHPDPARLAGYQDSLVGAST